MSFSPQIICFNFSLKQLHHDNALPDDNRTRHCPCLGDNDKALCPTLASISKAKILPRDLLLTNLTYFAVQYQESWRCKRIVQGHA